MKKTILARWLVDGRSDRPISNPAVIVEEGRIRSVRQRREGGGSNVEQDEPGTHVIDLGPRTLMPGLIDAHVHLALAENTEPLGKALQSDPSLLALWVMQCTRSALGAGVTTLRDCGGPGGPIFAVRTAIREGLAAGPRLWASGPAITTTGGHCDYDPLGIALAADSEAELRKAVRGLVKSGADFIKVMATGGAGDPQTNRHRAQYSAVELRLIVEEAERLRRRVTAHVNATEGIRNAVSAGVHILSHCDWLGPREGTLDYDEALVETMALHGAYVDFDVGGLKPHSPTDTEGQHWDGWPIVPKRRWDMIEHMRSKGVHVFLTTDAVGRGACSIAKAAVRMVRETGLSPAEVIGMITAIPAEALGIEHDTGTIEPGKSADIIALDGSPLEDITALERVRDVFAGGTAVVREGAFLL